MRLIMLVVACSLTSLAYADDLANLNRFIFAEDNAGLSIGPDGVVVHGSNWSEKNLSGNTKSYSNEYGDPSDRLAPSGVHAKPNGANDESRWVIMQNDGKVAKNVRDVVYVKYGRFGQKNITRVVSLKGGQIDYVANCSGDSSDTTDGPILSARRTCMAVDLNVCNNLYAASGVKSAAELRAFKAKCEKVGNAFADPKLMEAIKKTTGAHHDEIVSRLKSIRVSGAVDLAENLDLQKALWATGSRDAISRPALLSICEGLDASRARPAMQTGESKSETPAEK